MSGKGIVNQSAMYHRPKSNYCYAYRQDDIRVMLRTARGDAKLVEVLYGDTYAWHRSESTTAGLQFSDAMFDYHIASISHPSNRLSYFFRVHGSDGEILNVCEDGILPDAELSGNGSTNGILFTYTYPYVSEADIHRVPEWVKDGVFYQIFPDSYRNGNLDYTNGRHSLWEHGPLERNSIKGGNLRGILDKLGYIQDLGADCIYMTPIFKAASNHKYDTADYYEIDAAFGTKEDFRALVDAAHDRGMKIILDAVFNHCGRDFAPFRDAEQVGPDSRYYDWFYINRHPFDSAELVRKEKQILQTRGGWTDIDIDPETGEAWLPYRTFGFTPQMPKLNTSNPEVAAYFLDVAEYWIREFDIDGWRLDVANEVDHAFWRAFRKRVKSIKPDCYIVGEVWRKAEPWLQGDQMDSMMNYQLMLACVELFARRRISPARFRERVSDLLVHNSWQVNETMMNLLESHDTERFLNIAGSKERLLAAFGFIFAFVGAPYLYYGSEIGMNGGMDPDNRRHMIWDREQWDLGILQQVKTLISIRKESAALRRGGFRWVEIDEQLLSFERFLDGERILVLISLAEEDLTVSLPAGYCSSRDMLSGKDIKGELTLRCDQTVYLRDQTGGEEK